jgi:hypothetical protein
MPINFFGIYKGVVTQVDDPENLGRIKAQIPQVLGQSESDWAWPAQPNIAGITPLDPGDPVWVIFEGGDPHYPVWLGTWMKVGTALPPLPDVEAELEDENITHWMTRVTS